MDRCYRCGLPAGEFKLYQSDCLGDRLHHLGAAVCVEALKQETKRLTAALREIADSNFMLDGMGTEDLRLMAKKAIEHEEG